jgi:hypothetical protein
MNEELEKEFQGTTLLLLGTALKGLDDYGEWLGRRIPLPRETRSAVSGKEAWVGPSLIYLSKDYNLKNAILLDEMDQVNKSPFAPQDVARASVRDIMKSLVGPVRYHVANMRYQAHENVWKCSGAGGGRNLYHCDDVYLDVKNVAYSNFTLWSHNAFGCHGVTNSGFVIHAYNCSKVARCFEVDGCSDSSGLLFCHNCENVQDSMFCFNAKNLRYAIGNVQVPPDKYKEIKARVLAEISAELEKTKSLERDIFNIGCRRERLWHHRLTTR